MATRPSLSAWGARALARIGWLAVALVLALLTAPWVVAVGSAPGWVRPLPPPRGPVSAFLIGGSGDRGAYRDRLIDALAEAGIKGVRLARTTSNGTLPDAILGVPSFNDSRIGLRLVVPDVWNAAEEGHALILIGYSWGAVLTAQTALAVAEAGGRVDHLVLIAPPIEASLLAALDREPGIGAVHVIPLTRWGDPIRPGDDDVTLALRVPRLAWQRLRAEGHFALLDLGPGGDARRADLAGTLADRLSRP